MIPPSSGCFGPIGTWVTQTQLCHQKAQPRVANNSWKLHPRSLSSCYSPTPLESVPSSALFTAIISLGRGLLPPPSKKCLAQEEVTTTLPLFWQLIFFHSPLMMLHEPCWEWCNVSLSSLCFPEPGPQYHSNSHSFLWAWFVVSNKPTVKMKFAYMNNWDLQQQ